MRGWKACEAPLRPRIDAEGKLAAKSCQVKHGSPKNARLRAGGTSDGIEPGAYTVPALTTVAHPRRELGRLAAGTLLDLLDGAPTSQGVLTLPIRLPIHLRVRSSCGARSHSHDPAHPGTGGGTP